MPACQVGSNIIGQNTVKLTNNAQELTPYRLGAKCYTNKIGKYFLSVPRFESGSQGCVMDKLANSATPPFLSVTNPLCGSCGLITQ